MKIRRFSFRIGSQGSFRLSDPWSDSVMGPPMMCHEEKKKSFGLNKNQEDKAINILQKRKSKSSKSSGEGNTSEPMIGCNHLIIVSGATSIGSAGHTPDRKKSFIQT
jgi:hypothetical protein